MAEYVPFIVLLFSLYVIAGGIVVRGDIRATPLANTSIIGIGGLLASFIGTTGSAMLLIRLLLKTNSERKYKVHTVIFFIFIAANIGGSLLPIGDPPLFLGYLRGVSFFWTLQPVVVLAVHAGDSAGLSTTPGTRGPITASRRKPSAWTTRSFSRSESPGCSMSYGFWAWWWRWRRSTPVSRSPVRSGTRRLYLREGVQLVMAAMSMLTTQKLLRKENQFNFVAIGEVACLFIGIFITMQVPIEILKHAGPQMADAGFDDPWQFFWATGAAQQLPRQRTDICRLLRDRPRPADYDSGRRVDTRRAGGQISLKLLIAISCGAVFMGANSYIGNGPNFMVKAIAEQSGVKMPSFFGYMVYSVGILIPLFVVLTLIFFRG